MERPWCFPIRSEDLGAFVLAGEIEVEGEGEIAHVVEQHQGGDYEQHEIATQRRRPVAAILLLGNLAVRVVGGGEGEEAAK